MAIPALFDPAVVRLGLFDPELNKNGIFDPEIGTSGGSAVVTPLGLRSGGRSGIVAVNADANVSGVGLVAGGRQGPAFGGVVVNATATITTGTGLVSGGRLGALSLIGDSNSSVGGLDSGGRSGVGVPSGDANTAPSGLRSGGRTGAATVTGDSSVTVTLGLMAGGRLGIAAASTTQFVQCFVTGLASGGRSGTTIPSGDAITTATGANSGAKTGIVTINAANPNGVAPVSGKVSGGRMGIARAFIDQTEPRIHGAVTFRWNSKFINEADLSHAVDVVHYVFGRSLIDQLKVGSTNEVLGLVRVLGIGDISSINLHTLGNDTFGNQLFFARIMLLVVQNREGLADVRMRLPALGLTGEVPLNKFGFFVYSAPLGVAVGGSPLIELQNYGGGNATCDVFLVGAGS